MKAVLRTYLSLILGALACISLPAQAQWQPMPSLNTARYASAAVATDQHIYVFGGATFDGEILNTVEVYDPLTSAWDTLSVPPFDIPRVNATASLFNNKIFLMGGRNPQNVVVDAVEVFDLNTREWSTNSDLLFGREGHVTLSIFDNICSMAGIDQNGVSVEDIEWYSNGIWQQSSTTIFAPRAAPFAAAHRDTVYLFGGINLWPSASGFGAAVDTTWTFDWFTIPSLATARGNGASAVLDNKLYMMGGITTSGSTNEVEIFDLETKELAQGEVLTDARSGMAAVTFQGEIFLMGGYIDDPDRPLDLVERNGISVSVGPSETPPESFYLLHGYPNPFNGAMTLEATIARTARYSLDIYDINGRHIRSLLDQQLIAGTHRYRWDARNDRQETIGSGVYIAILRSSTTIQRLKVIYIK